MSGPVGSREQILARLEELLGTVPGIVSSVRNRGDVVDGQLPALILLDGREETISAIRGRDGKMTSALIKLIPEIVLIAHPRDTVSNLELNEQPAPIGPELSEWRDRVLLALTNDVVLLGLLTSLGQIAYLGLDTDMRWGSSLSGAVQFHLEFTYVWVPPTA